MIPYQDALNAKEIIDEQFGSRDDVLCVAIGHTKINNQNSQLAIFITVPSDVTSIEDLPDNIDGVPIILESLIEF